nr:hypothetical protein CFP56_08685 [Quercus suber]
MVVWALWNRRNNIRLSKNAENLDHLLQRARERVSEFSQHSTARTTSMRSPTTSWQPPGSGQYKLNVDGAIFAVENTAGLGVVIMDEHGQVMVSLSEQCDFNFDADVGKSVEFFHTVDEGYSSVGGYSTQTMVELENGVNEGIVGDSMVAFDDESDMGLERFEGYFANCTVENGVDR